MATTGAVAAAFRHRTSRAGDPLLHTHVLVANLAQAADDGVWRTLDSRRLYAHAKTAGFLYQAHLRRELTRRLGVAWEPVVNGTADIAGVPRDVIEAFSRRRSEILATLEERGESSARAAQVATLDTRRAKHHDIESTGLRQRWRQQADQLGFDVAAIPRLLHRHTAGPDGDRLARIADELLGPEGLTEQASTFTRRDAIQAWCERLPTGATVADVERLADALLDPSTAAVARLDGPDTDVRTLTSRDVIRRADGTAVPAVPDDGRYSTPELLALEQRLLDAAVARQTAGVGQVDESTVEAALRRRPTISGEQAEMVRRLTGSGAGVEVVVGKAGTGKTFALDAARDAWTSAGYRVVGAALAARAALELESGAGIDSYTIERLLADLDHPEHGGLAPDTVLVVDEAGMVGTRKLARLLDHATRADAKVVLVGDPHQLPEIDTGGVLRGLVNRLDGIELHDNRRQVHPWERAALDELRSGDPAAALDAYRHHDRLVLAETAEAVREQLVGDWWHARSNLGLTGVMVAARRSDVTDLNGRARARLADAGELAGPEVTVADRRFRRGDDVICLRNDRRLGVVNGTRGTVTAIDPERLQLTVEREDGRGTLTLPASYLQAGHLDHAYAVTCHKAQGMTCDATWVLGSDAVYREWGYTAMSRGRHRNHLYVVGDQIDPDVLDTDHGGTQLTSGQDPIYGLARDLACSRAKRLATDHTHGRFAQMDATQLAATHQRLRRRVLEAARACRTGELERLHARRQELLRQQRELSERTAAATGRPRPLRRLRRNGRDADRTTAARELCTRQLDDVAARIDELESLAGSSAQERAEAAHELLEADAEIARRASLAARATEFHPPAYIAETLGRRPADPEARTVWRAAVGSVERFRAAWGIDHDRLPLGERPRELAARRQHDALAADLVQVRHQLLEEPSVTRGRPERALAKEL